MLFVKLYTVCKLLHWFAFHAYVLYNIEPKKV